MYIGDGGSLTTNGAANYIDNSAVRQTSLLCAPLRVSYCNFNADVYVLVIALLCDSIIYDNTQNAMTHDVPILRESSFCWWNAVQPIESGVLYCMSYSTVLVGLVRTTTCCSFFNESCHRQSR